MIATGVNDPLFPGASMKPPGDMQEIEFHPPSQYRGRDHGDLQVVPPCVSMLATRPRRTPVTV